jgi:histidine ammonia-lyase
MNHILNGQSITIESLFELSSKPVNLSLDPKCQQLMEASRASIDKRMKTGEAIYGVNTGFGSLSSVRINESQIEELQRNLIRSHSVGIGEPFTRQETRAIMILRANTLARGLSGVRPDVVLKLLEYIKHDVIPVVPSQGSVGASGDLAPLSHLALGLIGEGQGWNERGERQEISEILKEKKLKPLVLQYKEGLSLINGCQVMTAIGLLGLYRARNLVWLADLAGAMTLEGLNGSRKAFDPLISAVRPHKGEINTAFNLRLILGETSEIGESHRECARVQDAYSLRCMPAVHGAVKDQLRAAISILEVEANAATDNPLVFAKEEKILSCGNFHGMPVAFAMDNAGIALSALASISEQRISKLVNPAMSGLPAFLAPEGGLHSGHMISHVAAASLVSENKILAHPASVDSIPTSADKEDHVSMGTIAARKFVKIVENVTNVLALEFLSASQAVDLVRPLKSSAVVEKVHAQIRTRVPFAPKDRYFGLDIEALRQMIISGELLQASGLGSGGSESLEF